MGLPAVSLEFQQGGIKRPLLTEDGISAIIGSGIAVSDTLGLGTVYICQSISDVQALGLNAAYDTTNSVNIYKHCADFYAENPKGELHVMVLAKTVTMAQMLDPTNAYAKKILDDANGKVKLLAVSANPASDETVTNHISADTAAAVTMSKSLITDQLAYNRPVQILVEGRLFDGTVTGLVDMRTKTANRCSVILGSDTDRKGSNIGMVLGRLSVVPVQTNIGDVSKGVLQDVDNVYIGNTFAYASFSLSNLDSLHDKGYIFPRKFNNVDGFYWCDDATATALTDDYAYIGLARAIDKAYRIAYQSYVSSINTDIEIDPITGLIPAEVLKALQANVLSNLNTLMLDRGSQYNNNVSGLGVFIDPDQDILTTSELEVQIQFVARGVLRNINIKLGYTTP